MARQRRPRGYSGDNHEAIGSDVLSVLKVISFAEQVLGKDLAAKLASAQPDQWYPIQPLLDAMERLDEKIGRAGLLQMGRSIFRMSHEEEAKKVAKSAGDIIFALDDMYRNANRGRDIGGWKPIFFRPGKARVEKNTPHHCVMEEGLLLEALRAVGVPAMVSQLECFRSGAPLCVYELTSVVADDLWMGKHKPLG